MVFFLCLLLFFWLGIRYEQQKKPPDKEVEDETIRKQKKIHEDFMKMMNYDVNQATAPRQVKLNE